MANPPGMEVPEAMRQMAEKNIEQARTTYAQLLDTMRKSQEQLGRSFPFMNEATLDLQTKMMRFTEENLEAGFKLAVELARARDMKDYFDIQGRHAQRQMQVYALQAQELGQLMATAAQRSQPAR
jgi:phasin